MTIRLNKMPALQGPITVTLTADAAGSARFPLSGMFRPGATNMGVRVDVHDGSVTVFTTNENENIACNPDHTAVDPGISWKNEGTSTPGAPVTIAGVVANVLRLDFAGPGRAVVASL